MRVILKINKSNVVSMPHIMLSYKCKYKPSIFKISR
nr:MAG TPA: hypothetical protein [Caudoviricetes sp.]